MITAVNGKAVKDSRELARRISETAPGTTVKLDVMRQGSEKSVEVTLGFADGSKVTAPFAVKDAQGK